MGKIVVVVLFIILLGTILYGYNFFLKSPYGTCLEEKAIDYCEGKNMKFISHSWLIFNCKEDREFLSKKFWFSPEEKEECGNLLK